MCSDLSSTPALTHWIPHAFVYFRAFSMTIFTSLLHHRFPFQHGHSPCKHVLFLINKKISLDQQLPAVPSSLFPFTTKLVKRTVSTCCLYFISSSSPLEWRLFITTTAAKLVLSRWPQCWRILIPCLTRLISSIWRKWSLSSLLPEMQCVRSMILLLPG